MPNTLGGSFKEALKEIDQDQNQIAIYDYCDGEDFEKLWSLGTNRLGNPHIIHIIIVWDGRGWSDDRNENLLAPHLTPMDWALAFSIKVLSNNSATDASIHIVDLTGEEHDKEWTMRMRHQLLVEMPWVKLYAPLTPEKDGKPVRIRQGYNPIVAPTPSNGGSPALLEALSDASKCPNLSGDTPAREGTNEGNQQPPESTKSHGLYKRLRALLRLKLPPESSSNDSTFAPSEGTNEKIQSMKPSVETPNPEAPSDGNQQLKLNPSGETLKDAKTPDSRNRLITLAKQWGASLTQSNDHHDINNVIGPSFLGKKLQVDGLRRAFHIRLLWCDPEISRAGIKQWQPKPTLRDILFFKPLSVIIVDDHLEEWGEFICKLLNKKFHKPEHYCNSEFKKISEDNSDINIYGCTGPDPLIKFLEERAKFEYRDFTQQTKCRGNEDEIYPEVILLDLRLPNLNKEKVKKLLKIIPKKTEKLAWPEIRKEEIESIEKWCNGKSNDDQAADKALLLLPRLLAMALPLTPIILFSATGQTWIKETLKSYQNIFTGFEKPRVLSNPEVVENSIAALHEGLDKAIKMMRLRLQLAHAQKAVKIADNKRCQNGISDHHIEIYADETGKIQEGIASGVAFCVFSSEDKADKLQEKLENYDDSRNSSSNDKGIGANINAGNFELIKAEGAKDDKIRTLAKLLNDVDIKNCQRQFWSVIWTKMQSEEIGSDVSLGTFPDSPLDSALRFNLEFSLFVLIPYLSSNFAGEVSIYLPTRDVDLDRGRLSNRLADAFDLLIPDYNKEKMIRTWPFGSAFPIVRGWLQEWGYGDSPVYEKIKKIKMTTLGDKDNKIKRRDKNGNYYGETDYDCETGKYPRLFHGIADWVCKVTPRKQPRSSLERDGLFPSPNWFVSEDEKTTEGGRKLMQALKASVLRSGNGSKDRDSDALRLLLENSYVGKCKAELLNDESCSQQRLILWALRKELDDATGQSLHLLCV